SRWRLRRTAHNWRQCGRRARSQWADERARQQYFAGLQCLIVLSEPGRKPDDALGGMAKHASGEARFLDLAVLATIARCGASRRRWDRTSVPRARCRRWWRCLTSCRTRYACASYADRRGRYGRREFPAAGHTARCGDQVFDCEISTRERRL